MADQVTRVTNQSWFSRLGKALGGMLTGVVLVFGSAGVLVWNENRAVQTERSLSEGAGAVISLDENGYAPPPYPDDLNSRDMLVHVTGRLEVPNRMYLRDNFTLPKAVPENATRLQRVVEMYQWKESSKSETRNKLGGGTETVTTYSYAMGWSETEHSSGSFAEPTGHQNPPMPFRSESYSEDRYLVVGESGWFVAADKVAMIGTEAAVQLTEEDATDLAGWLNGTTPVKLSQNALYVGFNPSRPQIGDLRISYRVAQADSASVVAMDKSPDLVPFTTSNGREIYLIAEGKVSAADMFAKAQADNATLTWLWRAGGVFAMFVGFGMVFGLLGVIADVIPVLGSVVRFGTGLIAFGLTLILAPLVIGLAWIAVRPVLAFGLIGAGLALGGFTIWRARRSKAVPAAAAAA
jgi:hypothetical protein